MAETRFKPRQAVVTIYGGDYLDRIRHLERQYDQLTVDIEQAQKREASTTRTMDEDLESVELTERRDAIAREHAAVKAEADQVARTDVTLQALPRKVWKALVAAHPARKAGDDGVTAAMAEADARVGVNEDTFQPALVGGGTVKLPDGTEAPYRSIVEPDDLGPDELEELSDAQFDQLYLTAFALNRTVPADPKASLGSPATPTSSATSA